jgi:hypothetical protein
MDSSVVELIMNRHHREQKQHILFNYYPHLYSHLHVFILELIQFRHILDFLLHAAFVSWMLEALRTSQYLICIILCVPEPFPELSSIKKL